MIKFSIDLPVSIEICFIFLKNEKLHFLKSSLIFLGSVPCQLLKKSIFLLACWFFAKNFTKCESPKQNSHDPPDISGGCRGARGARDAGGTGWNCLPLSLGKVGTVTNDLILKRLKEVHDLPILDQSDDSTQKMSKTQKFFNRGIFL